MKTKYLKFLYKVYYVCGIVILILASDSCFKIERVPTRWKDDGSANYLTAENSVLFQSEQITILKITSEELQMAAAHSNGMIYVWAPWCAPCLNTLKYHFAETFKGVDRQLFVSINYDLLNIVTLLEGKVDTAYVLNSAEFGTNESAKMKGLSMSLIDRELDFIPQLYFFQNGEINLQAK